MYNVDYLFDSFTDSHSHGPEGQEDQVECEGGREEEEQDCEDDGAQEELLNTAVSTVNSGGGKMLIV